MTAEVIVHNAPAELPEPQVAELVLEVLEHEDFPVESISVSFVDEPKMQELNRTHRDKDASTDVLSFPYDDSFPHGRGGEIVICPAVAAATKVTGGSLTDELEWLVVHGALHLTGMTDNEEADAAAMEERGTAIMRKMRRDTNG